MVEVVDIVVVRARRQPWPSTLYVPLSFPFPYFTVLSSTLWSNLFVFFLLYYYYSFLFLKKINKYIYKCSSPQGSMCENYFRISDFLLSLLLHKTTTSIISFVWFSRVLHNSIDCVASSQFLIEWILNHLFSNTLPKTQYFHPKHHTKLMSFLFSFFFFKCVCVCVCVCGWV